jgi:hypothetical protein
VRSHDRSQAQVLQICRLSTYCFAAAALVQPRLVPGIAIGSIQSPLAIWFHLPFGLFPAADWCDVHLAGNSERREMRADCIRDVRRGQMRIVFFRHPRVGVTELSGDDA